MNEGTKIALRVTLCIVILVSVISLANVQEAQKKNTDFINSLDKTCVAWLSDELNEEISIEELYSLQAVANHGLLDESDETGNLTVTGIYSPAYLGDGWDIYYRVENSSGVFYESMHFTECVKFAFVVENGANGI